MAQVNGYGIEVLVGGKPLTEYVGKDGTVYVAGPDNVDYVLRVIVPYGGRHECVASVDGLSIMTTRDATASEGGYIVTAGGKNEIPGFRLNDEEVANFHFGDRFDAYAAKIGKPKNVGVIGAVFYDEYRRPVLRSMRMAPEGGCLESFGGATRGGSVQTKGGVASDMGTEFGKRADHHVDRVHFDRGQQKATIVIRYASEAKLRELGIIAEPALIGNPFPGDGQRAITDCQPPAGWDPTKR